MTDTVAPWLRGISPGGRKSGFLQKFPLHSVGFVDNGDTQLVVTFDNLAEMGETSLARSPWSYDFFAARGCSVMGVMARRGIWFRDPLLIDFLKSLSHDGFFDRFDKVLFTGNSMGGFGALAFAPLAPGADVLSFSPQTTLDKAKVPWETRFEKAWDADWSLEFSDAADGANAAGQVSVIYDPVFELDRLHVDRLTGANVQKLTAWYASHKSPVFLRRLNMLKPVSEAALSRTLTPDRFYALYRQRRDTPWYRNSLRDHATRRGHDGFATRLRKLYDPISKAEKARDEEAWLTKGKALQQQSRSLGAAQAATTSPDQIRLHVLSYHNDPLLLHWLNYHAQFLNADQITLLHIGPAQDANFARIPVSMDNPWHLSSALCEEAARIGLIGCTLMTNEFLVADPDTDANPFELLATDPRPHVAPFGIELTHHRLHHPQPIDLSSPLLPQRAYFRQNSRATRTVAARAPIGWNADGQADIEDLHVSEDLMLFNLSAMDHDNGCRRAVSPLPGLYAGPSDLSRELDVVASLDPVERQPISYRVISRLYANWAKAQGTRKDDQQSPRPEHFTFKRRLFSLPPRYLTLF